MHFTNIPDLYLALPDYNYYDSPYPAGPENKDDRKYIRRKHIEDKIRSRIFDNTASNAGSILVTGFRGSGKSSVVRKVIRDERSKERNIWFAELNLAQDDINERNILKLIATALLNQINSSPEYKRGRIRMLLIQMLVFPILPVILLFFFPNNSNHVEVNADKLVQSFLNFYNDVLYNYSHIFFILYFVLFAALAVVFPDFLTFLRGGKSSKKYSLKPKVLAERLESLLQKIDSSVTEESQKGIANFQSFNPFNIFKRKQVQYRNVNTKEIELEIVDVLHKINTWKRRNPPRIIFLIDELDKLIPNSNKNLSDRDREDPTDDNLSYSESKNARGIGNDQVRQRQELIAGLFANLKHFLNVAQAKFVFIGGRELFDAILADTSNRDPFLGSIFYDTIYVPSFLKEEQVSDGYNVSGITTTIEQYIAKSLLSNEFLNERILYDRSEALLSLTDVMNYYRDNTVMSDKELLYAYHAINNFICFLTFRSNGIPKKMVRLFENYIVSDAPDPDEKSLVSLVFRPEDVKQKCLYLKFNCNELYAHHLLNGFYKPFILKHSRSYKALNDVQLVSFTYVLDHLFKFHAMAFSSRYLELTPEIIALNKVPEFRKFLNYLLDVLSVNQIRTINNGLFNYQFFRKTSMEISYLTKISEYDSASMNFTLDESLPLKQHYYKRLKHYSEQYSLTQKGQAQGSLIDSVGQMMLPMYEWLGDLHFFDGEFDEASAQYRSGASSAWDNMFGILDSLKDTNFAPVQNLVNEYTKMHLKRILCLDKMRAYEDALSLNADLLNDIFKIMQRFPAFSILDNWRLYVLAICNYLALLEKSSYGGIRKVDIEYTNSLIEKLLKNTNGSFKRLEKNIRFSYCDYIGQILFYKNLNENGLNVSEYYHRHISDFLNTSHKDILIWEKGSGSKMSVVAGFFSRLGDYYLSTITEFDSTTIKNVGAILDYKPKEEFLRKLLEEVSSSDLNGVRLIINYYARAYSLFVDSGVTFRAVFQLKKILFTLLMHKKDVNKTVLEELISKAIAEVNNYQSSHGVSQIRKIEYQFKDLPDLHDEHSNSPYVSEILEFYCLKYEIYLKDDKQFTVPEAFWVTYAQKPITQFTRLQLLKLKIDDNFRRLILKLSLEISEGSYLDVKKTGELRNEVILRLNNDIELTDLIADSIYCCSEAIKLIELFGMSIVAMNSMLATNHRKLGMWAFLFDMLNNRNRDVSRNVISRLLDRKVLSRLDAKFHFSSALYYYDRCYQQHHGGKFYPRILEDIYLLEEDYSDNLIHFNTALERGYVCNWKKDSGQKNKDPRQQTKDFMEFIDNIRIGHSEPILN